MRNTSLANVIARHKWLLQVMGEELHISKDSLWAFRTIKSFCQLEIAGKFQTISLNTIKSICKQGLIPNVYAPAFSSQWEYFLDLYSKVQTLAQAKANAKASAILTISDEEKIKQAHLQAQLCTLAFYNLLNGMNIFLETQNDLSELSKARLQRQIDIATERFKFISSPSEAGAKEMSIVRAKK
ncbi:hypothetical protein [Pseudomonas fluorescens]|uniref:Uncharacterized protein n=1 Tax=Pseudomonas fluorescens TaxID=294 RepID=A0A5E7G336_PSEFL|nr:hypothetical protein [Pseudomonas fluorescens]VVO45242.1 hypothetical protein PS833_06629 [Pseudomonas fluorescens]